MIRDLVALFGAGIASCIAPCMVPLLPAYLGIITGEAGESLDVSRAVPATAVFVLGFATIFAGLGATAGLIGSSLQHFQLLVQRIGGVIIVIMGVALLGLLRGPLSREFRAIQVLPKLHGPIRPYVVGVAFGAAWTPCVGPLLGAALAVAAGTGQVGRGALLLMAYALGIGVPFLLASLGLASWPKLSVALRRAGHKIQVVAGSLLIVLGLLLATDTYRHLTSYLARFTPAVHGL